MRKRILILLVGCLLGLASHAQQKDTLQPYQLYPKLPAFNILLTDSTTIFNTYNIPSGKKTMLLFFSPDCSHCQALIKKLLAGMDSLKDIQFYLFTPVHSMTMIRDFSNEYHLQDYKNIQAVGRDYEYFFASYYGVKSVPDMVLYDEHKKLIKLFEGNISITEIYKYTH